MRRCPNAIAINTTFPLPVDLRRDETASEKLLWEELRGRNFRGLKFRRQHAIERYVVDFFCDDYALIVEVDGEVHLDPDVRIRDIERQTFLESRGYRMVRVSAKLVSTEMELALERIGSTIDSLSPAASGERAGE